MVRILPINEISERKKFLVAQSDIHRRTLQLEVSLLQHSVTQFKELLEKRLAVVGLSSVAVSLGASLARHFFGKKDEPTKKPGIISKVLSGVSFFSQIKGLFNRSNPAPEDHS